MFGADAESFVAVSQSYPWDRAVFSLAPSTADPVALAIFSASWASSTPWPACVAGAPLFNPLAGTPWVGDVYGRLGNVTASVALVDPFVTLFGSNSVIGRSVMATFGSRGTLCAVLQSLDDQISAEVTFRGGVQQPAGSILFTHRAADPLLDTAIFVDLKFYDGTGNMSVDWQVHASPAIGDTTAAASGRCASAGSVYDPFGLCSSQAGCDVSNLGTRLGLLSVPGSAVLVGKIALAGMASIVNRSIVLLNSANSAVMSCATVRLREAKQAFALVTSPGFNATVVFSQELPFGPTVVGVMGASGAAGVTSLAVNQWPAGDPSMDMDVCNASFVGGVYDPVNMSCLANCSAAVVGRLSSRMPPLLDGSTAYLDFATTLFGEYSVMGRSLVVVVGSDVACATITAQAVVRSMVVHFTGTVSGFVRFEQNALNQFDATTVVVALARTNSSMNHLWHVHSNVVTGGVCATAGPHFNPFSACITGCPAWYAPCSPMNMLGCEAGDLAGKNGPLSFLPVARNVFNDAGLPLSGLGSISYRSVVVHAPNLGSSRIACANMMSGSAVTAVATFSFNGVTGTATFHQDDEASPCTASVALTGLPSALPVVAWSVYSQPATFSTLNPSVACAAALAPPFDLRGNATCQVHPVLGTV